MTDTIRLAAPKARRGYIEVEEGDGIAANFLRFGQHPYCKGIAPTILTVSDRWTWVVVRDVSDNRRSRIGHPIGIHNGEEDLFTERDIPHDNVD